MAVSTFTEIWTDGISVFLKPEKPDESMCKASSDQVSDEELANMINHGDIVKFQDGVYQVSFVNTVDLCSYEIHLTSLKM